MVWKKYTAKQKEAYYKKKGKGKKPWTKKGKKPWKKAPKKTKKKRDDGAYLKRLEGYRDSRAEREGARIAKWANELMKMKNS